MLQSGGGAGSGKAGDMSGADVEWSGAVNDSMFRGCKEITTTVGENIWVEVVKRKRCVWVGLGAGRGLSRYAEYGFCNGLNGSNKPVTDS